ncbi:DsrE family protein [Marinobacter salarius]|uniref:DsrE family protein n=1 Tax=Marinobacter salarius TaxID=1420917 RepID=UPI00273B63FB|nr:DsrE family protein [Marinobacter salarius]MDP4532614.1 DsrE family protein [Marinobacter salarius]
METLVIISRAPYCDWTGRESLDMAFSLAAFDQPVTLLFTGEGVNWLRKAQQADAVHQKSVEKNLSAAPIFGVSALMADHKACKRYGLNEENMMPGITTTDLCAELLEHYAHVVNLS